MPPDSSKPKEKTLFGIKSEDIFKIVLVNYTLLVVEGAAGLLFVLHYHILPMWLLALVFLLAAVPNLILHGLILLKAPRFLLEVVLFILGFATVVGLTLLFHIYPDARPSFILFYLPSIIFTSSQSLSYGITNMIIVFASLGTMMWLEIRKVRFIVDTYDFASMPTAWKVGMILSALVIAIVGFMAIYFSFVLRKRQAEIAKLAEDNKKLYQQSKTTSDEILKNMREGLIVLDNHFRIVQYNSALREIITDDKDLTNFPVRDIPLFFAPKLLIYLEDFKKNVNSQRFSFKVQDELKNMYDIGMAKINLKKSEPGFMIMINQNPLPWGLVFDAISKKPIDLALVRLHNAEDDRIIETRATDKDGRFGFIVAEGKYKISVTREGYAFPSKSSEGYIGEEIKVASAADSFLNIKIPMDSSEAPADTKIQDSKIQETNNTQSPIPKNSN